MIRQINDDVNVKTTSVEPQKLELYRNGVSEDGEGILYSSLPSYGDFLEFFGPDDKQLLKVVADETSSVDLTGASVFYPDKEWGLYPMSGAYDLRVKLEVLQDAGFANHGNIQYLEGVDYDDPDEYHEVSVLAYDVNKWARANGYDAVIYELQEDETGKFHREGITVCYVINPDCVHVENPIIEKIVKKGSKWQVQSEDGSRNLGTYDTKAEAEKRLRQVHYFKHMKEAEGSGSLPEDVKVATANISGAEFVGSKPRFVDSDAYARRTPSGGKSGCVSYSYALTDEHVSALVGFLEGLNDNIAKNVRRFRKEFSSPDRPLLLTASLYMTEKGINTLWYELDSFDHRWNMRLGNIHISGHEYLRPADSDDETLTDDVNEITICLAIDKLFGLDYTKPSPATLETAMADFDAEYQREHPLGEDVNIKAYAAHQRPFMTERRNDRESGNTNELWELPPDCVNILADMLDDVDDGYGGLPDFLRHLADAGDSVTIAIDDYADEQFIQYTLIAAGGTFILIYLPKDDLANGMKGYGDSEPVREAKLIRILDDVFGFDVAGRFLPDAHVDEDVEVRPSGSPLVKLIGVKYPNPRETIYMYSLGQEGLDRLLDAMLAAGRGFSANVYDDIRGGRFPNAQLNVRVNNQDRKTDVLQCSMYLMQTQGKSVLDYEPLCTVGLAMEGDRLVYGGDLDATLAIEKGLDLPYKHASDFIANAGTEPVHIVDEDVSVSASANTPPLLSSRVSPDGVSFYIYDLSEPEMLALSRVVHDHETDLSMYTPPSVDYMARKISKGDDFAVRLHIVTYELEHGYAAVDYRLDTSDSDGPIDSMTIAQCGGNKGNGTMEADKQARVLFDIDAALGISHATELFRRGEEPAEEGLDEDVRVSASGDALTLLKDGKGSGGGHWWTYGINDPAAIRTLIQFAPSYGQMLSSVADMCDDPNERPVNPKLSVTVHPTFVKYDFRSDRSFNAILLYVTAPAAEDHTDVRRALMLERALGISHLPEWLKAEGSLTEPDAMEDRSWKDGSWKRLHSEDDEDSIPLSMAERYVQMDADDFRWSIRVKGKDGEWLYGRHYELDDQRLNGLMTLSQAYWLLPKAAEAGEADIVIDVSYNDRNAYSIMTMRKGE